MQICLGLPDNTTPYNSFKIKRLALTSMIWTSYDEKITRKEWVEYEKEMSWIWERNEGEHEKKNMRKEWDEYEKGMSGIWERNEMNVRKEWEEYEKKSSSISEI